MKSKNIRILGILALAAAVAAGASTASAAGLLGQRYVAGTVDYVLWDDDLALDDGLGFSLTYNQPLSSNVDLRVDYSWLNSDITGFNADITAQAIGFSAAWFMPISNSGKFYIRGGVGWVDADFVDDETVFDVDVGVEFLINQSLSVTPYVTYSDTFDNDGEGTFNFGVVGEIDLGNSWSWLIVGSIDEDSNAGISSGFALRF